MTRIFLKKIETRRKTLRGNRETSFSAGQEFEIGL